jgi:hypothetical protein
MVVGAVRIPGVIVSKRHKKTYRPIPQPRPSVTFMSQSPTILFKNPESPKKAANASAFRLLQYELICVIWSPDLDRGIDRIPKCSFVVREVHPVASI